MAKEKEYVQKGICSYCMMLNWNFLEARWAGGAKEETWGGGEYGYFLELHSIIIGRKLSS